VVRRRLYFWSAIALAAIGAVVAVVAVLDQRSAGQARATPGPLVTTFLPGEHQNVPQACKAVAPDVLDQYMPGRTAPAAVQPLGGQSSSECSWTVDKPHTYRFLEVEASAYAPSGLASGNGSATQAARDAFATASQQKAAPPRSSGQPKATVAPVSGLGQQAFSAEQRYTRGGVTDVVTVEALERNALVTVVFEARTGGRYGQSSASDLMSGAEAAAREVIGKLG
jgi:hypothetical protein